MSCFKRINKDISIFHKKRTVTYNEYTRENLIKEVIRCGGCGEKYKLGEDKLKIHCNLCEKFFHCRIAGKCIGEDCKITKNDNSIHRASYCLDCVSIVYPRNRCMCKDCYNKNT